MIEVSREIPTSPERVFDVLADGWSYAGWVVGNSHIRAVDEGWPAVGTRIHHSAGLWPVQVQDNTEVVAVDPNRMLELDARLWLFGAARIKFTLTAVDGGRSTHLVMGERAERGPWSQVPQAVQAAMLRPRNIETVTRLCDMAVGRAEAAARAARTGGEATGR